VACGYFRDILVHWVNVFFFDPWFGEGMEVFGNTIESVFLKKFMC
jgi:hypothetical protein